MGTKKQKQKHEWSLHIFYLKTQKKKEKKQRCKITLNDLCRLIFYKNMYIKLWTIPKYYQIEIRKSYELGKMR